MAINNPRRFLGTRYSEFVRDVQELKSVFTNGDIVEVIYSKYNLVITKDQVRYYARTHLTQRERLAKYDKENELMDQWNGKQEAKEDSNYAEELFKLSQGLVQDEDFNKITKDSKVY